MNQEKTPPKIVNIWTFVTEIAEATCPILDKATGIDCIRGITEKYELTGQPLPFHFTPETRALMSQLLTNLPPLSWPISPEAEKQFMEAYGKLEDRPQWTPRLITQLDLQGRREARKTIQERQFRSIQERVSQGKMKAFSESRVPEKKIGFQTYILRREANEYLEHAGLLILPPQNPVHLEDGQSILALDNANGELKNPLAPLQATPVMPPLPQKGDALAQIFWEMQFEATHWLTTSVAWHKLQKLVEKNTPPLIGVDDNDIAWLPAGCKEDDPPEYLTRADVKSRLFRQKKSWTVAGITKLDRSTERKVTRKVR